MTVNTEGHSAQVDHVENRLREGHASLLSAEQRNAIREVCRVGRKLFETTYRTAIVHLEHEARWTEAIELAEAAIGIGIEDQWYRNRVEELSRLQGSALTEFDPGTSAGTRGALIEARATYRHTQESGPLAGY